ncbi:MAG TPA: CHRD domain-containing protein [Thermoanaerobaculia bacterium]|nr:CHRD domain-containing protein [Thermoanaerobaculia bacterium]
MKRLATLLFLALMPLTAAAQSYSAILSGAAEVPGPGDTDGVGFAVVTLDGTTLRYTVFAQNIGAPVGAHIHPGVAGVAGPVLVGLDHNMLGSGSVTVTEAIANQIRANPSGFYVNVHTAEFPAGAIRGQLAASTSGDGTSTSFIPVVGKVRGANNTNFVTDLRIVNNGGATASVTLDFFAQNAAGQAAPTATQTITVAPGEQKVLDDVVGTTLATNGVLGGLRITASQNVIASARIINDLRSTNAGTSGFAVDAEQEGETTGTILFLANNPDYRTNLGYFNPSASPATVTLVARRAADGAVLGTNTVIVPGHAMLQQGAFALISSVPEADRTQQDFYVTWTSSAPLFVYGAVTDNKTGDAVLNQ